MKTRVLLPILAMVFSVLFFSCSGRGQVPKAAVPAFFAETGVPNDVARQAREIVAGRIARNLDFADKPEADIIIAGEIRLAAKDGIMDRFADRLRGNPAWFELEVQAVDAVTGEVVASFTGTKESPFANFERFSAAFDADIEGLVFGKSLDKERPYIGRMGLEEDMANITDLCTQVVLILGNAEGNTQYIIEKAREALKNKGYGTVVGVGKRDNQEKHWAYIAKHGDWVIQRNSVFGQYRILGPDNRCHASIWKDKKLEQFLTEIIKIGNSQGIKPRESTMTIYQIETDANVKKNPDCNERLMLEEANRRFPNSKNLARGFYTVHPADSNALVPVENFFGNIALDRDHECVVLLGKMGAKSVRIEKAEESTINGGGSAEVDIKKVNVKAGLSIGMDLQNFSKLEVTFQGNVESEISRDMLTASIWFRNDPQMKAILESRLSRNKSIEWDVSTGLNSTFNFDFNAAAKILGIPVVSLEVEYKQATTQSRNFHVAFGDA